MIQIAVEGKRILRIFGHFMKKSRLFFKNTKKRLENTESYVIIKCDAVPVFRKGAPFETVNL